MPLLDHLNYTALGHNRGWVPVRVVYAWQDGRMDDEHEFLTIFHGLNPDHRAQVLDIARELDHWEESYDYGDCNDPR